MKFKTLYSKRSGYRSCSGSPEYKEGRVKFSPDGNLSLEYGKTRNRQVEINSYKAACDVNNLVKRYENGDQLALLRNNTGVYADISELPRNIHEATKLAKDVNAIYDSMGDDVKAKYQNFDEFSSAFSSKAKFNEFLSVVSDVVKSRSVKINKPEGGNVDA